MKKSFLAIISVVLMVATCTLLYSCGSNDDDPTPTDDPVTYVDVTFCTAVLDSQLAFVDHKFEFKVDGAAKTITLDEMTVDDNAANKTSVDKALTFMYGSDKTKWPKHTLYKVTFPVKKGSTVTFVKFAHTAKGTAPELFDYLNSYLIGSGEKPIDAKEDSDLQKGMDGNQLQNFLNVVNKEKNITITAN